MSSWKAAYDELNNLESYGDNALGLFAMGMKFGLEDLESVGIEAVTDGSDDKKLDIVYLNEEERYAVISQCYYSTVDRERAKSNKASDLNIGLAWLLQRDIDEVPDRIKSAAINIRNALSENKLDKVYIWYVHNLPQSEHVQNELITVQQTATTIIKSSFPASNSSINIYAQEIGKETLSELYEECKTPILMNEEVVFESSGGYQIEEDQWISYSAAIKARDLARLYKKHKTKIFSANIRDYLGSRASDSNINNGIKKTIDAEPKNFWAYNNGLTILTHRFTIDEKKVVVKGLSVVNGAQTTGAIGSLSKLPVKEALVQVRFIAPKQDNSVLLENIIRYNNSQNKVEAADFRSTDRVQKRLKDEFIKIPNVEYEGGRRGSAGDAIQRRPNLLPSYSVGQSLAAFHGDPIVAYNQKAGIWINNNNYDKLFNDETKAPHIVCVYGLVKSIEKYKKNLQSKGTLSSSDEEILDFLRQRGAIYLMTHTVASCLEIVLGRVVTNPFRISFGWKCSLNESIGNWDDLLEILMPFANHLNAAVQNGLKSNAEINTTVTTFKTLVNSTRQYHSKTFDAFKSKVSAP